MFDVVWREKKNARLAPQQCRTAAQRCQISLDLLRAELSINLYLDANDVTGRLNDEVNPIRDIAHRATLCFDAITRFELPAPVDIRQGRLESRGKKSLRDTSTKFREPQACERTSISNFVTLKADDRPRVDDAARFFGMRQALPKILECALNLPQIERLLGRLWGHAPGQHPKLLERALEPLNVDRKRFNQSSHRTVLHQSIGQVYRNKTMSSGHGLKLSYCGNNSDPHQLRFPPGKE